MKANLSKVDKMKSNINNDEAKTRFRNPKEKVKEDIKHDRLLRSQVRVEKSVANEIEIIETHEMETTSDDSENPINWSISDVCRYLKEQKLDEYIVDLIRDDVFINLRLYFGFKFKRLYFIGSRWSIVSLARFAYYYEILEAETGTFSQIGEFSRKAEAQLF